MTQDEKIEAAYQAWSDQRGVWPRVFRNEAFKAGWLAAYEAAAVGGVKDAPQFEALKACLDDLIREQSEGEWDDKMIRADVEKFADRLWPICNPAPSRDVAAMKEQATHERNLSASTEELIAQARPLSLPIHGDDCEAMQRPRADCTCVPRLSDTPTLPMRRR